MKPFITLGIVLLTATLSACTVIAHEHEPRPRYYKAPPAYSYKPYYKPAPKYYRSHPPRSPRAAQPNWR